VECHCAWTRCARNSATAHAAQQETAATAVAAATPSSYSALMNASAVMCPALALHVTWTGQGLLPLPLLMQECFCFLTTTHHHTHILLQLSRVLNVNTRRIARSFMHSCYLPTWCRSSAASSAASSQALQQHHACGKAGQIIVSL
jgi:hypothetical protein